VPPATTPLIALKYEAAPRPSWSPAPLNLLTLIIAVKRGLAGTFNETALCLVRCNGRSFVRSTLDYLQLGDRLPT